MKLQEPLNYMLYFFVITGICFVVYLKILGSTQLPVNVELNGYCKQYGEDWYRVSNKNICKEEGKPNQIDFTEQEFRNYCPQNRFISTKIYSDCFHKSGSIV